MSIKKLAKSIQRAADRTLEEALTLHRTGRLEEAFALYREILRKLPAHPEALKFAAAIATQQGRHEEAQGYFARLLAKGPPDPVIACNYAVTLGHLGRLDEAVSQFDRAIQLKPDYLAAHYNRAVVLQKLGRHAESIPGYDRAIAINPTDAQIHNNRGVALHMIGRNAEALASYARALALNPRYGDALVNKGHSLRELGRHEDALGCYDAAFAAAPTNINAQFDRALCRLLLGNFAEGLPQFEARWAADPIYNPKRNFSQPVWGGEALAGRTILLHAEQGFGDTIQMARYVPLVARRGGHVILEVDPSLVSLLSQLNGASGIVAVIAKGSPRPPFDLHCPLMSMPLAFHTRLDTIPGPVSYLTAEPARVAAWHERLEPARGPRIGLVWAGGRLHLNDKNRSIGLERIAPLIGDNPTHTFVSLQKECGAEDRQRLSTYPNVCHFTADALRDFADTAALIACLDAVISVDTSVAHLSGALGKRTWLMLPFVPDWRWLLERRDSPWYPAFTLFRQHELGDWDGVVADLRRDLAAGLLSRAIAQ